MKKYSFKKNFITRLAAFASAVTLSVTLLGGVSIEANAAGVTMTASGVSTEGLNNKVNAKGEQVKIVTGAGATTNLKVKLTAKGQTVSIYKIASVPYSEEDGAYKDPVWVDEVTDWMKADTSNTYRTEEGAVKSSYSSPANLASASQATWDNFYKNLLYNEDSLSGPLNVIKYGKGEDPDNEGQYLGKLTAVASQTLPDDAVSLDAVFANVPIGIYAVMVSTSSKRYLPVVAKLVPEATGPDRTYFIKQTVEVEIKASEATIDKRINGADAAAVSVGERVKFDINITMPTLEPDRVTLNSSTGNPYVMYIEDTLSKAFSIKDSDVGREEDEAVYTFKYKIGSETKPFPTSQIDYYTIADSTYDKSGLTEGSGYFALNTDENVAKYTYDFTTVSGMKAELGEGDYYAIKQSGTIFSPEEAKDIEDEGGNTATQLKINVNELALKQLIKSSNNALNLETATVILSYDAVVTSDIEIASENNYNTAKFVYDGGRPSDTVRAYTYGLQIIKKDGANDKDIAGAKFSLYKETITFLNTSENDLDSSYVWAGDMEGHDVAPEETPTYSDIKKDIQNKNTNSNYYIYSYTADDDGVLDSGVEYHTGNKIARIFEVYTLGYINEDTEYTGKEITSNGKAGGLTVKGLDEGNYILSETKAPIGYNELSEDVMFSIKLLAGDQLALENNGSMAKFLNQDNELVEDGIIPLTILNYRGLTLPSTGGKGTLIFAVVGVGLMVMAMAFILLGKKKDESYYM